MYCLQTVHDGEGRFSTAVLYSDPESIKPIADACDRINAAAHLFS
jgi:hypothetical protein